ncbi:carbon-nitrogen hydrolase family protein, partial [bacterium]|nr:carbon-nitrogen hydrolase family protein [Candidatus Omnitrophota bacterium]MBU4122784.1 carbon-nitrogen hydrolase family protein [bacterium]
MKKFVASCVQMYVVPNDIKRNTAHALEMLDKAQKYHSADLVVFQETVTTGFTPNMDFESFYNIIDTVPGRHMKPVMKEAAKRKMHIVWPVYEKDPVEKKIYNSAVLIGPDGEIIGKYRKTHPFGSESVKTGGWTTPGNSLDVFDTELGKIGMIICYDGDFPETVRLLAQKGAEIIVRPSAFLRNFEIWSLTNRARAFDNHVFMIAANATGVDAAGHHYFGHSMIAAPNVTVLALASASEDIISAQLDPAPMISMTPGSTSRRTF